jgi:hypothetical protein
MPASESGAVACKSTFLTDVCSLNGSFRCSEAQSNVFVPSSATLSNPVALRFRLVVEENVRLLLKGALRLDCQFGRHDCNL